MKVIDFTDDAEILKEHAHLIEYQVRPANLPNEQENFRPREVFPMGNLLCGDLVVNEEFTAQLEIHPFPEWVVQLMRLDTALPQVNGFNVALNLDKKELKKISRLPWKERVKELRDKVKAAGSDDLLAFKLAPGVCVEIFANVPHYAICAPVIEGKTVYPYMQVFEPSIDWESVKVLAKMDPTAYFPLSFQCKT